MMFIHIGGIKNANAFADGVHYMSHQHEEIYDKNGKPVKYEPILGDDGKHIPRNENELRMQYIKGDGTAGRNEDFVRDCMKTWVDNRKQWDEKAKKADHYVTSLSEEDTKNMTMDEMLDFSIKVGKKVFKGHQFMVAIHGDTDNLHAHYIVNSCRETERDIVEAYMDKNKKDQVYAAEYKAGGKHRDTPKYRRWCNEQIMELIKENSCKLTLEDWNKVQDENKKAKAKKSQTKAELLHEAVLIAVSKSKNQDELKKYLQDDYGIAFDMRGSSPRFLYPGQTMYQRADKIGLTPKDLTPDLHQYYKPKRDDKVAAEWLNRNNKEWKRSKRAEKKALREEVGEDIVIDTKKPKTPTRQRQRSDEHTM